MLQRKRKYALVCLALLVIAAATIGVAYGYWATTQNTDNTSDEAYIIITPSGPSAYTGAFSSTIKYDTVNDSGTITYSLSDGQTTEITVGSDEIECVKLGELTIGITQQGGPVAFDFTMTRVSGTMTGTFYVGVSTSTDGTNWSAYTYQAFTSNSFDNLSSSTVSMKVALFVDSAFQPDSNATPVNPLDNVTFRFKAESVE